MTDKRPSPDELLRRLQQEETRAQRGRLKVFLGASPGVGKTYTMLEMARAARQQGLDVAIGVVETHGRQETARLLEGLETLPRRDVEYRNTTLKEFDLDGALLRHPHLLVVDELAHTNAPGSRHAKRWQDVDELLEAGINVYTTLNVQHLESLNDVVAQITGIRVRETVPDSVLERADEVELVDLPPDELLQRMREGKVYLPEAAGRRAGQLLPEGQPDRAAGDRAAPDRRAGRRRRCGATWRNRGSGKPGRRGTGSWSAWARVPNPLGWSEPASGSRSGLESHGRWYTWSVPEFPRPIALPSSGRPWRSPSVWVPR